MNHIQYFLRRLLLIIPTLFGVTLISFFIMNMCPGGPIEQKLRQMRFGQTSISGGIEQQEISEEMLQELKKQYGFDKPLHEQYWLWLKNLSVLDFGESFTYEEPVIDVIVSKFPVSLQFGIVSFILSYLVCIPLGILKALKQGSTFDLSSSFLLFIMYSIPGLMLGILEITYLAGESGLGLFPIGGLYSDNYENLSFMGKVWDRVFHFILPLSCFMIGSFTTLTLLMKNSLIEEIKKDYIRTARAKGLSEKAIYLKHALRNALIPIATGIGSFISLFFTGSIIIESIFELDGMGLLSFNSILERDYNVSMGLLFITSLLMMLGNMISDVAYILIDPRIDFK